MSHLKGFSLSSFSIFIIFRMTNRRKCKEGEVIYKAVCVCVLLKLEIYQKDCRVSGSSRQTECTPQLPIAAFFPTNDRKDFKQQI